MAPFWWEWSLSLDRPLDPDLGFGCVSEWRAYINSVGFLLRFSKSMSIAFCAKFSDFQSSCFFQHQVLASLANLALVHLSTYAYLSFFVLAVTTRHLFIDCSCFLVEDREFLEDALWDTLGIRLLCWCCIFARLCRSPVSLLPACIALPEAKKRQFLTETANKGIE